ncbi:sigma factor [Streptomyces sp. NPDC057939]|uniref:sigma factor n=1 Tax=Streptomyces sp. NPDC057939 TaxID=3346284 RepID=UPI0036EB7221
MDESSSPTERFEEHRAHLRAVAYRMLGSLGETDDALQETWLRLSRTDIGDIENLGGRLTTVTARVCLNMLRSRGQRREEPMEVAEGAGIRMPDPIIGPERGMDPEQEGSAPTAAPAAVTPSCSPGPGPWRAGRSPSARSRRSPVRR